MDKNLVLLCQSCWWWQYDLFRKKRISASRKKAVEQMTCFDRLYEKPVCVESLSVFYDRDCAPAFCTTWIRMWNVMQCERFYSWMFYQNVLVNTWCIQKVFSYRWWLPGMITIIATCFFSLSSWLDNWIMPVQSHLWWSWISYGLFLWFNFHDQSSRKCSYGIPRNRGCVFTMCFIYRLNSLDQNLVGIDSEESIDIHMCIIHELLHILIRTS